MMLNKSEVEDLLKLLANTLWYKNAEFNERLVVTLMNSPVSGNRPNCIKTL